MKEAIKGDCFDIPSLERHNGDELTKRFMEDEINKAVWDCDSNKSPRPNGFSFGFSRSCWSIVKEDLMRALNEFYEHGKFVRGMNFVISGV